VTAVALRWPEEPRWPVTVTGRGASLVEGGPMRVRRVYLDPPSGRVLDVLDPRASFIGFLHRFHENLTIPGFFGRHIVGWLGTGMLVLALTGLWLWWPRNGILLAGLRWRRAPAALTNLHFLFGFWIAAPLAVVSFTGMYLAFPQTARSIMSTMAPMSPQALRPGFGEVLRETARSADDALAKALESEPGTRPAAVFLPTAAALRAGDVGRGPSPAWRIQLRNPDDLTVTVMVDDRTGTVRRGPDPLAGDRAAQWMRWIHEGSHSGPVWQVVVFLTGICPAVLGATGLFMWLRGRRDRKPIRSAEAAGLASDPAL
jgi:uncharacterized iron-regulated membrane protein